MSRGVAYLDASAVVKLVLEEAESRALAATLREHDAWASSAIVGVEVHRAVLRVAPDLGDHAERVLGSGLMLSVDARVLARAQRVGPAALGALDAVHLATALEFRDRLAGFHSYDRRLAAAAEAAGLQVAAPGA